MDRIGIAASKIAKGNIFLYNVIVIFLIGLFALFIFVIAGASVMLALIVVGMIVNGMLPQDFLAEWNGIISVCMAALTVVVSFFAIIALIRNFKLTFTTKASRNEA